MRSGPVSIERARAPRGRERFLFLSSSSPPPSSPSPPSSRGAEEISDVMMIRGCAPWYRRRLLPTVCDHQDHHHWSRPWWQCSGPLLMMTLFSLPLAVREKQKDAPLRRRRMKAADVRGKLASPVSFSWRLIAFAWLVTSVAELFLRWTYLGHFHRRMKSTAASPPVVQPP